MRAAAANVRLQGIALLGVVERNAYLVKRYGLWELAWFFWTVANTLTVVFIAKGIEASGGRLLALDTAAALRRRYDAPSLEDAFLAATGRAFEPEEEAA